MNTDKTRLIENFFSLSFLQSINYLLPLVTVPYLVRVLGPSKFGLIAFVQSFVQYFIIITDYGFNLSATRNISIVRNDPRRVSQIFNSVMIIKLCFFAACLLFFTAMVWVVPKFREYWPVYFFTFGMVAGNVIFPTWFFQGIERMKHITTLNLLAKAIFTAAIFVFVKREADYIYVPVINSFGYIAAGALSLYVAFRKFGLKIELPSMKTIISELKDGWHLFISTVSISLYTGSNTFILGLFTDNTIVGYYSAAEKIINIVQGMFMPVSQSVYPYISKLASESKDKALRFLRKTGYLLGPAAFVVSFAIFCLAGPIVNIALGGQYERSVNVVRVLAFVPFIVGMATIYAKFFLLSFGYLKELSRIMVICGLASLIMAFVFIYFLSLREMGAAIAWLITECFVLISSYITYKKYAYRR